jgi:hypothetical protein
MAGLFRRRRPPQGRVASTTDSKPITNEADVLGSDGELIGGVSVFLEDGYLDFLETYS